MVRNHLPLSKLPSYLKECKMTTVFISKILNPFKNSAIEALLFNELNISKQKCALIWRNTPSIFIGRFQNPWEECDMKILQAHNISLCRRESGGGAVFHDLGNMNYTFFTTSALFNRKRDMNLLVDLLSSSYYFNITQNNRYDLILNDIYKISGSSARILRDRAYHHCTLLCNVDTTLLKNILNPNSSFIHRSSSSKSFKASPTCNLFKYFDNEDFNTLCEAFIHKYRQFTLINEESDVVWISEDDETISELSSHIDHFTSLSWIYGHTPPFTIKLPISRNQNNLFLDVINGIIENISFDWATQESIDPNWKAQISSAFIHAPLYSNILAPRILDLQLPEEISSQLISNFTSTKTV